MFPLRSHVEAQSARLLMSVTRNHIQSSQFTVLVVVLCATFWACRPTDTLGILMRGWVFPPDAMKSAVSYVKQNNDDDEVM